MSDQKKQSFLHGTALLAMATAAVKIIGAIYKIPLSVIIGDQGFAYFNTAYEIYNVLLMIATAGLPVAMSRMISEQSSLGNHNQVRRTYRTAKFIFLLLGLIGTLLMTVFCRELANFQGLPEAWSAIGALGPCVLLICVMSSYRGFFQGHGNMIPTSVSQVLEALCKLIVGMAAAIALLKMTGSIPFAAAGAILGVTASCVISALYLAGYFRKSFQSIPHSEDTPDTYGKTAKTLLAIAIPITIGSAGLSVLTMLETKIYMSQIKATFDATMSESDLMYWLSVYNYQGDPLTRTEAIQFIADTRKGIYDFSKTIFNMPCAFITPITISIIPAITSHLALKNYQGAKATEESAIRITGLVSMPCAMGLAVVAGPVMALLRGYTGEKLALATVLLTILGICVVFNALVLLTNAIMQSHGHANLPVINLFIGGALKLVAVYILSGNPEIGIIGGPIGSILCYGTITVLNIITMRRCIQHPPAVIKNLLRSLLSALLMGIVVLACRYGLDMITDSRVLLCGIPVAVGVVVYALAAIKLKAITREDCLLLPKGAKIAKILHL